MKTIGVIGSRRRASKDDMKLVHAKISELFESGDRLCSGGCQTGGDRFAETWAKTNGVSILIHYPNWKIGRHAGFARNTLIARSSDIMIACVAPDRTGGTEDTLKKFGNKPVYLV